MSNRKMPRLACLAGSLTGSSITAAAPWGAALGFYRAMIRNIPVFTEAANVLLLHSIISEFDTTLRDSFDWTRPETHGKVIMACMVRIGVGSKLGPRCRSVAVIKLQSKDPNVFGEHGANSRVFLIDVSFNLGLMLGPLLSGSLTEVFGFYYSCGTWGEWSFQSAQRFRFSDTS
ncbi:uncharacterized protein ATNIH1004_008139 [Aspergillus tanneri]|uniref:Major facilitator superfamily (MFS) profile domain-containing protein n=1 Tax=Aspergillus tanneri TaxID=1220188 RepID=A0A5M9MG53_9EURO|nr:uncharacterized protein ATNIH1004_008139 [Aspergillus tanneri]KAA8643943.1 hypothetical protein ATNIH1004_008139 [Aspergillus tanneri]